MESSQYESYITFFRKIAFVIILVSIFALEVYFIQYKFAVALFGERFDLKVLGFLVLLNIVQLALSFYIPSYANKIKQKIFKKSTPRKPIFDFKLIVVNSGLFAIIFFIVKSLKAIGVISFSTFTLFRNWIIMMSINSVVVFNYFWMKKQEKKKMISLELRKITEIWNECLKIAVEKRILKLFLDLQYYDSVHVKFIGRSEYVIRRPLTNVEVFKKYNIRIDNEQHMRVPEYHDVNMKLKKRRWEEEKNVNSGFVPVHTVEAVEGQNENVDGSLMKIIVYDKYPGGDLDMDLVEKIAAQSNKKDIYLMAYFLSKKSPEVTE